MKDVRELLKTITTSDMTGGTKGGLMLPEQADRFIDLTLDYSAMLKTVRNEKKTFAKGEVDTLNIGSVVSEGASEEPALPVAGEEVEPTFGKIEYTMAKIRSLFDITTESLLDNVEAERRLTDQQGGLKGDAPVGDFRETLMRAYAKRIATDLELLAIQGDTTKDTSTKLNRLLRTNEGWDKLTKTGCHYVDAGYKYVTLKLFAKMVETMPAPYLTRINDLRWFVGVRTNIKWALEVASRETQLGDAAVKGEAIAPLGIPIMMVPLIPENQSSTVGTDVYSNLTFIWLTFPENFIFCMRRMVETYWEFVPRRDKWENTTYSETDHMIENKNCIVKATNLKVDATTGYGA